MYFAHVLPNKVQLSSGSSTLEIWPMDGAILNGWQYQHQGNTVSLIDGYESVTDFARHAETKGFRSCKLSPYVCRLFKGEYEYKGTQYHIGKYTLGQSQLHGLLYDVPFEVISQEATDQLAMVVLRHQYAGSDKGYPFPFDMVVTYTLSHQNKVTITTEVINKHTDSIPLADGWHPYFSLGTSVDNLVLQIATNTMVAFDNQLIPTGELESETRFANGLLLAGTALDNCFLLQKSLDNQPACTLTNVADGLRLSIYARKNYPYLQVYTPPHRNSIAIENLSGTPDIFNNKMGLIELEPGETIAFSTAYQIQSF